MLNRRAIIHLALGFFQRQVVRLERQLNKERAGAGDKAICTKTLEPHVIITYRGDPAERRLVCHDCGATFRSDENILSAPHSRSKLGESK